MRSKTKAEVTETKAKVTETNAKVTETDRRKGDQSKPMADPESASQSHSYNLRSKTKANASETNRRKDDQSKSMDDLESAFQSVTISDGRPDEESDEEKPPAHLSLQGKLGAKAKAEKKVKREISTAKGKATLARNASIRDKAECERLRERLRQSEAKREEKDRIILEKNNALQRPGGRVGGYMTRANRKNDQLSKKLKTDAP